MVRRTRTVAFGPPTGGDFMPATAVQNGTESASSGVSSTLSAYRNLSTPLAGKNVLFSLSGSAQGTFGGITDFVAEFAYDFNGVTVTFGKVELSITDGGCTPFSLISTLQIPAGAQLKWRSYVASVSAATVRFGFNSYQGI